MSSDDSAAIARCLADALPSQALGQIQFMSVDNPSFKYLQEVKVICPNLQVMALDPVHLAMTVEYASSRRRTGLSKALRQILRKLTAHSSNLKPTTWGAIYTGQTCASLTREEERLRAQIEDRSMRPREAQSVLDNLEPDVPFFLRTDWIRALAALTSVYRTEVDRVAPGPNRKVFQLLHSAAAAGRSEWYFNNLRMRHLLEPSRLSLLPIGTTSNEALHHEINNWFRETQKIHKATLCLKLSIMHLAKLLSHNTALYRPATRQMSECEILSRCSCRVLWTLPEWKAWCQELGVEAGLVGKADLSLQTARAEQKCLVQQRTLKRPAALSSRGSQRRTPHTLERQDSLRRAGKRTKQHAPA